MAHAAARGQSYKLLICSDVHGNQAAFEQVMETFRVWGVGTLAILGDYVGYGPSPNEVLYRLRRFIGELQKKPAGSGRVVLILGNHDRWLLGESDQVDLTHARALETLEWTRSVMKQDNLEFLSSLRNQLVAGSVGFFHASPVDQVPFPYIDPVTGLSEDLVEAHAETPWKEWSNDHFGRRVLWPAVKAMRTAGLQIAFFGHSHRPSVIAWRDRSFTFPKPQQKVDVATSTSYVYQLKPGYTYLINVGSVGMPRDGDNRACYTIFDPKTAQVRMCRLHYEVGETIREYARKLEIDQTSGNDVTLQPQTLSELVSLLEDGATDDETFDPF